MIETQIWNKILDQPGNSKVKDPTYLNNRIKECESSIKKLMIRSSRLLKHWDFPKSWLKSF